MVNSNVLVVQGAQVYASPNTWAQGIYYSKRRGYNGEKWKPYPK